MPRIPKEGGTIGSDNGYIYLAAIAAAAILIIAMSRAFFSPLRFTVKASLRAVGGLIFLALFNAAGSLIGITLGVNIWNAAVVGLLGVPGLALLLFSRWVLLL